MKSVTIKTVGKHDRERRVLLGLIDYYIQTGKPVGSNTLKETGFEDLSSATIRNYFAHLEEQGYLSQSHSSGGRIPTDLAYRLYAHTYYDTPEQDIASHFDGLKKIDSREIALFLQESAEFLSKTSQCAVFMSAPRFDHDFVIDLKLMPLDSSRCLCVIMTDFGVVQTEILYLTTKLSSFAVKRIESYFRWRLTGLGKPDHLEPEEEAISHSFYNELMLRYIVGYSNFVDEDIYRTGFSRLLTYPDFQDTGHLASGLSLFENIHSMRLLLKECKAVDKLKFWVGNDLAPYLSSQPNCSVMTIPYYINRKVVGGVGLLGPTRLPYRQLFNLLRQFSETISETLTRNLYKFKVSFRQPDQKQTYLKKEEHRLIGQSHLILLEDKSRDSYKEASKEKI